MRVSLIVTVCFLLFVGSSVRILHAQFGGANAVNTDVYPDFKFEDVLQTFYDDPFVGTAYDLYYQAAWLYRDGDLMVGKEVEVEFGEGDGAHQLSTVLLNPALIRGEFSDDNCHNGMIDDPISIGYTTLNAFLDEGMEGMPFLVNLDSFGTAYPRSKGKYKIHDLLDFRGFMPPGSQETPGDPTDEDDMGVDHFRISVPYEAFRGVKGVQELDPEVTKVELIVEITDSSGDAHEVSRTDITSHSRGIHKLTFDVDRELLAMGMGLYTTDLRLEATDTSGGVTIEATFPYDLPMWNY